MPKKRAKHDEGHDNTERWLLTYADMITLLTAFFIMMYSMSVLNLEKFNKVAISIRSGFGGPIEGGGHTVMNPAGGTSIHPTILPDLAAFKPTEVMEEMKDYAKAKRLEKELRLKQTERGLVVSIMADKMLFPKGRSTLTPQAAQLVRKVASLIAKTNNYVRIEGHTDNLPIHTAQFPSNWELSTARASTVVRYLIEEVGFDPARLSASGYADSRPLYPNDSEEHRAMNRRVDIVIVQGGGLPAAEHEGSLHARREREKEPAARPAPLDPAPKRPAIGKATDRPAAQDEGDA